MTCTPLVLERDDEPTPAAARERDREREGGRRPRRRRRGRSAERASRTQRKRETMAASPHVRLLPPLPEPASVAAPAPPAELITVAVDAPGAEATGAAAEAVDAEATGAAAEAVDAEASADAADAIDVPVTVEVDDVVEPAPAEVQGDGHVAPRRGRSAADAAFALAEEGARLLPVGGDEKRSALPAIEPEPDESVGAFLRRVRTLRRMPLEEVSASTRIPPRSLAHLEADELDQLPAEVFVRGFLRSYARAVGLPAEAAVALHDERRRAKPEPVALAAPGRQAVEPERRLGPIALVIIVVILATLTLSILFARPRPRPFERVEKPASMAPAQLHAGATAAGPDRA